MHFTVIPGEAGSSVPSHLSAEALGGQNKTALCHPHTVLGGGSTPFLGHS